MSRVRSAWRVPKGFVVGLVLGLVFASAGIVAAAHPPVITTPTRANQVDNIDVARLEIKNYYGSPGASTGAGATAGWTQPLNMDSNYAKEAMSVATRGRHLLDARAGKRPHQAIILDVDDTTLATWNYELYSNWDFNPTTNAQFVGLTDMDPGPGVNNQFTGNAFPAVPGMVQMAIVAKALGYSIFFITGRGDAQHQVTIANLLNDSAAGLPDMDTATINNSSGGTTTIPDQDAGYPAPTAIDTGHGATFNGGANFADGLFTKPAVGNYPSYLNTPEFCGPAIAAGTSCPTVLYKSGTRAYIESMGYTIVANFGDQFSDLLGGHQFRQFKMPNPNYYLP